MNFYFSPQTNFEQILQLRTCIYDCLEEKTIIEFLFFSNSAFIMLYYFLFSVRLGIFYLYIQLYLFLHVFWISVPQLVRLLEKLLRFFWNNYFALVEGDSLTTQELLTEKIYLAQRLVFILSLQLN